MKHLFLALLFAAFAALPTNTAQAAQACYSPAEVQAEQLLRLHSELMVITVTCRQSSIGQDLVSAYTGFTKENIKVLHAAEQTMIKHYSKIYKDDPVSHLDQLRTRLGNEFGLKISVLSAPLFCAQSRDKVIAFNQCQPAQISTEVARLCRTAQTYEPACRT